MYPTVWMVMSTFICYLFIAFIAVVTPHRLCSALKLGLFYGHKAAVVEFSTLVYILVLNVIFLSAGRALVV
jgi:hypothetical protein